MNDHLNFVLPFSAVGREDVTRVGGKGANLGEMINAGFPVPDGFFITTDGFREFINSVPGTPNLFTALEAMPENDLDAARRIGEELRSRIISTPIPQWIAAQIVSGWKSVGTENRFAVRSSATAEDLPEASFAGQQDTYLNVYGETELLDAVRSCWASLYTERAIIYRRRNGYSHADVELAVVVQQMVMSEKSGVMFTADPLSGHRHTLSIDATFGLGEALVSGLVSPDSYRVDKRSGRILESHISEKLIGIYPDDEGGTIQKPLPNAEKYGRVLSEPLIRKLLELGKQVESHYGTPQDIEWAITEGSIFLLQSRPISSLYPIDGLTTVNGRYQIYFSMGHQQNMTGVMAPLSISTMLNIIPIGSTADGGNSVLVANAGRLFMNLTAVLRNPLIRRVALKGIAQLSALAPGALSIAIRRREFRKSPGLKISWKYIWQALKIAARVRNVLVHEDLSETVSRANNSISEYVGDTRTAVASADPGGDQIRILVESLRRMHTLLLDWLEPLAAGEIAKRALNRMAGKYLNEYEIDAISLGLRGNAVTEMNLLIGDLADIARTSPDLAASLREIGNDIQAWRERAETIEGGGIFFRELDKFLEAYGARGPSEVDMASPKWFEDPRSLLNNIVAYLDMEAGFHRKLLAEQETQRHLALSKLEDRIGHSFAGKMKKRMVRRLSYVMTNAGVLREHHKYAAMQLIRVAKETLLESAKQLHEQGKIADVSDIWFLRWDELPSVWSGEIDVREIILSRRADYRGYEKLDPPLVITSDGEIPRAEYQTKNLPPGILPGQPVSAGVYEGTVRVIHDPATDRLGDGEILVAKFTDPAWTPLFTCAGALIMEIGGLMTHGSVVAREYGIPAIVGVKDACTSLRTGDRVQVDGNRGTVKIIRRAER
jgi:phosphohistidine swiveling domain-containing protein